MSGITKKVLDRVFSPAVMVGLGLVLGVLIFLFDFWNFLEPVTALVTLTVGLATTWQTRRAREAVYADNGAGTWVVALQVGRPVSEAVTKRFGQLDALIDVAEVLGGEHTLALPEHYEKVCRAVYAAICAGQGKNIHVVLSGPVALSFLIGQMVGLFHFQLTVYQFSPSTGGYEPMPRPTRAWLQHRT